MELRSNSAPSNEKADLSISDNRPLAPAAKLSTGTVYADQLAYIEEPEAELNKVWDELSANQRNAFRAEEKSNFVFSITAAQGDPLTGTWVIPTSLRPDLTTSR